RRPEFLAGLALSERVVGSTLLGIAQHLVGLADLLEARLGVGLLADVGMVLARETPVGALDLVGRRIAAYAHDRVVVFVFHGIASRLRTHARGALALTARRAARATKRDRPRALPRRRECLRACAVSSDRRRRDNAPCRDSCRSRCVPQRDPL